MPDASIFRFDEVNLPEIKKETCHLKGLVLFCRRRTCAAG